MTEQQLECAELALERMVRSNPETGKQWADIALLEAQIIEAKRLQCEHLWASQDEIGRPYCAACGMAWSLVRRIADPVGSPGERNDV